ncbi:hypothetical protein [Streptomyces pseudovenezuelae]|uniref:Uncharacterized protein n=1 Tax=Streptomyces pseudovenezuelae TaxID=67350 RepID=A0ABT6LXT9_9ACTN|nr:hypothetical protein [Streptomyces pseudovenezuelae]MDH6220259.1 hypothetical protein [Streptomyces pseudovenezuelae]
MGRSLRFTIFLGILLVLVSVAPAAGADDGCGGDFSARLKCWSSELDGGTVTVTLDRALRLDGSTTQRADLIEDIERKSSKLNVQVPAGVSTGEGGTVLLLLAEQRGRLVDESAKIDRLSRSMRKELDILCGSTRKDLCELVGPGESPMSGDKLITADEATEQHAYVVGPADDQGDNRSQWLLPATATVLVLLLGAFYFLVRRTRTPAPATAGQASRTADADEPTRALRTTPARSGGRHRARNRAGSARSAVVRTDLHPQGYVEVDRVLYRAVWAEPGQAPPVPGSPVDVTDVPEKDADVLHAFPPAAGRSAPAR